MPAGNISGIERLKRLHEVKRLIEEEKSDNEIADELGMSLQAVRRNKKWLDDLAVADLTSKEIGEKRGELYLELINAAGEAQSLFEKYRDSNQSKSANTWMIRWLETIKLRGSLFGLDSMKVAPLMQVNNLNQFTEPETLDVEIKEKIAKAVKEDHRKKLKMKEDD